MKSALLRLRESRGSMSATELAVADYLLSHPGEAMGLSIHQLAEKTFTSPSTVIRMCQSIGFKGYKEFRHTLTCEVAAGRLNLRQGCGEITRSDSLDSIVDKVIYRNTMALESAKSLIDADALRSCVELLRSARTVLLFGPAASLCAARELRLGLLRLDKPCVVGGDRNAQLLQAKSASKDDLAIVLSLSGETAELVECVKALRENGTPIIAVTQQADSRLTELSDCLLYAADSAPAAHSGAMTAHISQLNVIDILFTAFANSERGTEPTPRTDAASGQRPV